jgi:hypothetical protein
MTKSRSSDYSRGLRLAALVGILCLFYSPAQAASYGVNLIINGNAEQGASSPTGDPLPGSTPVPGWVVSSAFTVVNYKTASDNSGFPKSTDPGPPDRQNQFFAGGNAATSTATQEIDVTANAADINQGTVTYDLSGWLGGFADDDDSATLVVQFFTGSTSLGSTTIGPVTAVDRNSATGLLLKVATGTVPANTTRLHVELTMTRASDSGGAFNDGYADSLSLVLRAPYVVTTTADSGTGSLREAIVAGNTITFDPNVFSPASAPYTIALLSALPTLSSNISIVGPGKGVLTVQRSTTSGTPEFGIFSILNGTGTGPEVSLSGLTISNGIGTSGGGILSKSASLVVNDCVITGNHPNGEGGGIFKQFGTLTMNRCTVSGNSAGSTMVSGPGGGIANFDGNVTLNNCTVSNNTTNYLGGGLYSQGGILSTTLSLVNCTITGNSAIGNIASTGGIKSGAYTPPSNPQPANVSLSSCTINNNIGGNISVSKGGISANLTLGNTIIRSGGSGATITASGGATVTSLGYNMTDDGGGGFLNQTGDRINTDPMLGPLQDNGGPTFTHALLPGSLAIDKGNTNLTTDQRGAPRPVDDPNSASGGGNNSDIGAFEVQLPTPTPTPTPTPPGSTPTPTPTPTPPGSTPTPTPTPPGSTPTPTPTPGSLGNISTRLQVGTGNSVLFAGFIIQGSAPKTVLIRSAGPSLTSFGLPGALVNPQLELHDANSTIGINDDWQTTQLGGVITSDQVAAIQNSGAAPLDPAEPAIIATLPAGGYTAIVQGVGGSQGVATVEVYDLSPNNGTTLANISTRGFIQTGDNVMIGGFIVVDQASTVLIRATGPSLVPFGINNALANPRIELHDANGTLAGNDDWQTTQVGGIITGDQSADIQNSGLAPGDPAESAIIATLAPGAYTAIAQGVNGGTGVGLVEVFALP